MEDLYFDELFELIQSVNRRKIQNTRLELAIVQNPHIKDPQDLWKLLDQQERELDGLPPRDETFDAAGFAILKMRMKQNPRIIVK